MAALVVSSIVAIEASGQIPVVRRYNVVTIGDCVRTNGYTLAVVHPSGPIDGEPGIKFAALGPNENLETIIAVFGYLPNPVGMVFCDSMQDRMYARVYSANPTNGYLAGQPYKELKLARPIDQSIEGILVDKDANANLVFDTPVFDVIHPTNPDPYQKNGLWLGFLLTTNPAATNIYRALIPQDIQDLMKGSDGFVLTIFVKTSTALTGGLRIATQAAGFGQGSLHQSVFSNGFTPRGYVKDPNYFSYALGIETITLEYPSASVMYSPTDGVMNVTWTNVLSPAVYTIQVSTVSFPWTWEPIGNATAAAADFTWSDTNAFNASRIYRLAK